MKRRNYRRCVKTFSSLWHIWWIFLLTLFDKWDSTLECRTSCEITSWPWDACTSGAKTMKLVFYIVTVCLGLLHSETPASNRRANVSRFFSNGNRVWYTSSQNVWTGNYYYTPLFRLFRNIMVLFAQFIFKRFFKCVSEISCRIIGVAITI